MKTLNKFTTVTFLFVVMFVSGCASLNSVSLTQIPSERNQKVKVTRDKVIFLGFNFDNDFVDQMTNDLKKQCPDGRISGLLTKDENINYFLYIVWKKQVTAEGYCLRAGASTQPSPKKKSAENSDSIMNETIL